MCDDNFSRHLKKIIDKMGIETIKETLSKVPPGPTNEEFFGKEKADLIRERIEKCYKKE